MVFFSRKKKEESQKLLNRPKGLFGRRDAKSSDAAKGVGSKRAVRLFATEKVTPPGSPSSPLNITVVTTALSPEQQLNATEYDEELSEITESIKKQEDEASPEVYSSSLLNESNMLTEEVTGAHGINAVNATTGEPTAEKGLSLMACSGDTTTDVVNKILGMMDGACVPSDRKKDDLAAAANETTAPTIVTTAESAPTTTAAATTDAAVARRNDLATVMSTVLSGVLTRSSARAGEPSSPSGVTNDVPTWGVAPSQTEDDDTTQHAQDTREAVEETLQKSAEGISASTREAAATTATATDEDASRVEHEEFELVLGREPNEPMAIRRRNWLQRAREYQEEKKEDDMAAKSARYRAVFGADPSFESPKKNILPAFVKRLSLTTKPLNGSKQPQQPQQQQVKTQDSKPQVASGVLPSNASIRSLRPGLQMDESLRGVHYLEEEPEHEEEPEELKLETNTSAAAVAAAAVATKPAVVSPEIEKVQDGPIHINDSKRSRSWNQKLQNLMGGSQEEPSHETEHISSTPSSLPRTRSSPMRLLGFGGPVKPPKPTWKSALDPSTGVPYYYHRMTRQTTWTKPRDYDKQHEQWEQYQQLKKNGGVLEEQPTTTPAYEVVSKPKDLVAEEKLEPKPTVETEQQPAGNHIDVSAVLRKKSPRDFIPDVWDNKQKIVQLLTIMNPPNAESVERLMKQYEGREDELLAALDDLVQSQPFDEPVQTESSLASSELVEDMAALPEVMPNETYNRIRTEATATSGFLSQKTEKTEKHRNTGPSPPAFDHYAPLSTSTSFSSNLESHGEDLAREPSPKPTIQVDFHGSSRLNLPTVPRDRELVVEEFTTNSRLKKENFDRPSNRRASHAPRDETESSYNGDNDETDDNDTGTFGEDSISALSEVDGDFQRREQMNLVRQRLVEEANEAPVSQSVARGQPSEWKQSELDKFISENGWDAVASYVSKMKDGSEERSSKVSSQTAAARATGGQATKTVPKNESPKKIHHPPFAQRKFGARSQLQHSELREDSSCESESSYESDDYTVTSYESEDDPSSLTTDKVHRKEFVC